MNNNYYKSLTNSKFNQPNSNYNCLINNQKESLLCSLFTVENFLCNFQKGCNIIKLYNILK